MSNLVPLDAEEKRRRDRMLRRKRFVLCIPFAFLLMAGAAVLWFLQVMEHASSDVLWKTAGVVTAVNALGLFCLYRALRKIARDLQSNEKRIVAAFVAQGWQTNQRRDPVLTLNIDNRWVQLSTGTLRRLMDDVSEINRLYPGIALIVEMTPYGHTLTRITRE